jgi:hypothetical protein
MVDQRATRHIIQNWAMEGNDVANMGTAERKGSGG